MSASIADDMTCNNIDLNQKGFGLEGCDLSCVVTASASKGQVALSLMLLKLQFTQISVFGL